MSPREFRIGRHVVGKGHPTYFVADIGANHDGSLSRAIDLIHQAAEAGANAAKFQHFAAPTIVSDRAFAALPRLSHQAAWTKSVYETYADASLDVSWTPALKQACDEAGIDFFTAPYAMDLVDAVDPWVCAYKIGSGDITWLEIVRHIASKGRPVLLATGASSLDDVTKAVEAILAGTGELVLMQCNTNYTGSRENLRYVNLNVLGTYRTLYPDLVLGLSDHTPGHAAVLGAVALGARVVEKHFTDDNRRTGPDHAFALDPGSWREMIKQTRDLEDALGSPVKKVEPNEQETVVAQRRSVCASRPLAAGTIVSRADIVPLRPCPPGAVPADRLEETPGATVTRSIETGEPLRWTDLTWPSSSRP